MKNTNTHLHLNIILLPLFISNGRGAVGMVVFGWSWTVAYAVQSLVKEDGIKSYMFLQKISNSPWFTVQDPLREFHPNMF